MKLKFRKGITILELILAVVIISACFVPVAFVYQQALKKAYSSRIIAIGNGLAEGKMDEVLRLGYTNIANVSQTAFTAPYGDYTYEVVVVYVDAADLNTSVAGPTEYKRVEVRINHSAIGTIRVVSLLTNN